MTGKCISRAAVVAFHIFSVCGLLLMLLWPGLLSLDTLFRALRCSEEAEIAYRDGYVHGWQSEEDFVRWILVSYIPIHS